MVSALQVIILNIKLDDSEGVPLLARHAALAYWLKNSKYKEKNSNLPSLYEKQEMKFLYKSCLFYTRKKVTFLS